MAKLLWQRILVPLCYLARFVKFWTSGWLEMFIWMPPIGRKGLGNVRSIALLHYIYFNLFQCLLNGWPQSPWLTTCTPLSLMCGDMVSCYGSWSLWAGLHTLGLVMITCWHFSGLDIGWASHKDAQSLCKIFLHKHFKILSYIQFFIKVRSV